MKRSRVCFFISPTESCSPVETNQFPNWQLKMLKTLQEDLMRQTAQLDEQRLTGGTLTDEQQRELQRLADEQGQLADLTRNLTRALTTALQSDGDKGPPQEDR